MTIAQYSKYFPVILRPQAITIALLVLGLTGVFVLETILALKIVALFVCLISVVALFYKKFWELVIFLIFYLNVYNLYSLYETRQWSMWLTMCVAVLFFCLINYLFLLNLSKSIASKKETTIFNYLSFYIVLLGLIGLEIFLSLIPWPTSSHSKSIVALLVFYVFIGLISTYANSQLEFKKTAPYIIISAILLVLTIFTISWYSY